jgi:hypothetical protein
VRWGDTCVAGYLTDGTLTPIELLCDRPMGEVASLQYLYNLELFVRSEWFVVSHDPLS